MIGRVHRFHGHGSLRYVYSRGEIIRGQYFATKFIRNPKRKTYRIAVVVSKKVHKSAVTRNRIRRRVYEAIRVHINEQAPPTDIVCIIYSEQVARIPAEELHGQVRSHLEKAGVL